MTILFGMLATLTLAGWFLGWLIVPGPLNVLQITWCLWLVAAPAVMGLAALHLLLDAVPFTRRAFGEIVFFIAWMTSIAMPAAVSGLPSSFGTNMYDFAGFVRPLMGKMPSTGRDFSIGSTAILPGRIPLDVLANIHAPGYLASRLAWAALAVVLTICAGLLYRPHLASARMRDSGRIARWLAAGPPPPVRSDAGAAGGAVAPLLGLMIGEFQLIGRGRLFRLLAAGAALLGLFGDFRHVGASAGLLVMAFGLSAHAGRSEAAGLSALTRTAVLPPTARRVTFVAAGLSWSLLLALPAALIRSSPRPVLLMLAAGGIAAMIAIVLATVSRSSFAPRLVLLALWYGFLSS